MMKIRHIFVNDEGHPIQEDLEFNNYEQIYKYMQIYTCPLVVETYNNPDREYDMQIMTLEDYEDLN